MGEIGLGNRGIWEETEESSEIAPVSETMINKAEEELGVKLPQAYIQLLREQNGGSIRFNAHPASEPNVWAEDHVQVDFIMGIEEGEGILASAYLIEEWDMPKGLVLLTGDGHSWVALDYRQVKENPPVIYIDNEGGQLVELAPSFEVFLEGLYTAEVAMEDYEYREEIELSEEQVAEGLDSDDPETLIRSLNHLEDNPVLYLPLIEEKLPKLLKHQNPQFREFAVVYAFHFQGKGALSNELRELILSFVENDEELNYYIESFKAH